jgi:hypothetical protein
MRNPLPPDELGQRLANTIPSLRELTAKLGPDEWLYRPSPDEWSVTEIICHLRDVDREIHLPRLHSLIIEKEPFMPGVVSDDWAIERDYQAQDGKAALAALAATRAELLDLLPPAGSLIWQRRGRHTFFGPTSFLELVCLALEHDILHLTQTAETIENSTQAKQG